MNGKIEAAFMGTKFILQIDNNRGTIGLAKKEMVRKEYWLEKLIFNAKS